jgi:hypothetical protein
MHGYAAVHVVVFPDDAPIEIQIRTAWQHEWAELFEKLADLVGRGIRYGESPRRAWSPDDSRHWTPRFRTLRSLAIGCGWRPSITRYRLQG